MSKKESNESINREDDDERSFMDGTIDLKFLIFVQFFLKGL
jgi:hypothetical protein